MLRNRAVPEGCFGDKIAILGGFAPENSTVPKPPKLGGHAPEHPVSNLAQTREVDGSDDKLEIVRNLFPKDVRKRAKHKNR